MTRTRVVEVEQLTELIAFPEETVSAVMLPVTGEGIGSSALISSFQDSCRLAELITKQSKGSLTKFDDFAISILKETANIIGGAFLSEISNQTNISLIQSVPEPLFDTMKKVVGATIAKLHYKEGKLSVAFEIDFALSATTTTTTTTTTTEEILTHYIFLLEVGLAQKLFEALKK